MTLEERIKKVLEDVEKYFPQDIKTVEEQIKRHDDQASLIKLLEEQEEKITKYEDFLAYKSENNNLLRMQKIIDNYKKYFPKRQFSYEKAINNEIYISKISSKEELISFFEKHENILKEKEEAEKYKLSEDITNKLSFIKEKYEIYFPMEISNLNYIIKNAINKDDVDSILEKTEKIINNYEELIEFKSIESTQIRVNKILDDIKIYFLDELNKIENTLKNIRTKNLFIKELENLESKIEKQKKIYSNLNYSNNNNETYYAEIAEDDYIYDTKIPAEATTVEDAINKATKNYLDIDPQEVHDEKEYINFIYANIVWDEQIGYRVIENENGLFHVVQKESSYYIYPSKRLNLNDPDQVDLCNDLFKSNRKKGFVVGDEIELDRVEPAEIFTPFVVVADDQINQTTYSDVLIGEGIGLDETFKDGIIKDITQPRVENKLTKGKINVKSLEQEGFTFKEEIINEPIKYIDGTFIPYPRKQRIDEQNIDYVNYLEAHYKHYGYIIDYDDNGKPIYPHETLKEENGVIESQETFDDKFGIEKFLESRYGFAGEIADLEVTVMNAYLKAYREYLKMIKISNPEALEYINENLEATEEAIEDIKEQRIML